MNIRYEVREGVAVVTLDRPDKLNALTVNMREALGTAFETAGRDPAFRAVLLREPSLPVPHLPARTPDALTRGTGRKAHRSDLH